MSDKKAGVDLLQGLLRGVSNAVAEGQSPSMAPTEWWKTFRFPETPDFNVKRLMNCARSALFGQALGDGPAVHEAAFCEVLPKDADPKDVMSRIQNYITSNLGGRLVYNLNSDEFFYIFAGGAILASLSYYPDFACNVQIVGTTMAHMQLGKDLLDTCVKHEQVETHSA